MRPGARSHRWLLLAALLVGACRDPGYGLLLEVTAEAPVASYDLLVQDRATGEILLQTRDEPVPEGRDLAAPGEALRLAFVFARPGDYLVHVVGRGDVAQIGSRVFAVRGLERGALRLVAVPGRDLDGDGFLAPEDCTALAAPESLDCAVTDCDDASSAVNPAMPERCGNGVDDDCTGGDADCPDADGDGVPSNLDCDDTDPQRFPGNVEAANGCSTADHPEGVADPRCGDGVDQDCDGEDARCVVDADCDGFSPPADCDDATDAVSPGAPEVCGNAVDDNCNGDVDEGCVACDLDGDGYERADPGSGCPSPGYPAGRPLDCDDLDAGVHPGATGDCSGLEGGELACAAAAFCDGRDNDCDGAIDEGCPSAAGLGACDQDGDGFMRAGPGCTPPPGRADCDDASPLVYPGAPDRCGDGLLQNCNADAPCGTDADGDRYDASVDCDDGDAGVHPGALERCNGIDDDCDGLVDEGNPDADGSPLGDRYCNDSSMGACGDPGGAGRCVCARVVPDTLRDPSVRVACPGEDLAAPASPRCFFAPQPETERCDAADWDCDGVPDDHAGENLVEVGQPCGVDTGACTAGTVIGCDLHQVTHGALNPAFLCSADFVPPGPELCNGLDDDCDGSLADDGEDECVGSALCCALPTGRACLDVSADLEHCGTCTRACDPLRADRCVGGQCKCGAGNQCGPDKVCVPDKNGVPHCVKASGTD